MSDPLTPVLSRLAVRGSVFSRAELHAPWGVRTGATPSAIFHIVVRGAGYAQAEQRAGVSLGAPVPWRAGDLLLFPHGDGHVLTDRPGGAAAAIRSLTSQPGDDGLSSIATPGDGALTSLLCGTLRFDAWAAEMVVPHLPRLLHVPGDHGPTAAWLDATLRMLGAELEGGQPGSEAVVSRLAEVLFVQAVRAWATQAAERDPSWLAALTEPALARALAAMHGEPALSWTVDGLARVAGMSRSAFAAKFTERVGVPPTAHLTRWRLLLARRALATPDHGLAHIATAVGYGSEASFIRAFTREHGTSPTRWRRQAA
jgi:AraC-like DNA-binding protein